MFPVIRMLKYYNYLYYSMLMYVHINPFLENYNKLGSDINDNLMKSLLEQANFNQIADLSEYSKFKYAARNEKSGRATRKQKELLNKLEEPFLLDNTSSANISKLLTANRMKKVNKEAEMGEFFSQYESGSRYYYANGVKQDYKKAVYWFQKAAEQGLAKAQCKLGVCYLYGNGIKQDYEKAVYWFLKATEKEDLDAQICLGFCYMDGQGGTQDIEKAIYWYNKVAEKGIAKAEPLLGLCYYKKEEYEKAVYWYKKAAEKGDALAQHRLGHCYQEGKGVKQDYKEAIKLYKKAIEQGYAEALAALGICYVEGIGIKQNFQEGFSRLLIAAGQESELAKFTILGYMLDEKLDYQYMESCVNNAAKNGNKFAKEIIKIEKVPDDKLLPGAEKYLKK